MGGFEFGGFMGGLSVVVLWGVWVWWFYGEFRCGGVVLDNIKMFFGVF